MQEFIFLDIFLYLFFYQKLNYAFAVVFTFLAAFFIFHIFYVIYLCQLVENENFSYESIFQNSPVKTVTIIFKFFIN